jgi:phosphoribosylamine--glycine ligase/phosphoribosylaminoimidazole synthetase
MHKTVLLLGGGGREHALARSLIASPQVGQVFVAPGNGGIEGAGLARIPGLDILDGQAVIAAARLVAADLVVVGPEAPLAEGVADALHDAGIAVFGPSKAAAQLEASKAFSKAFMQRHDIPTARWRAFTDPAAAKAWIDSADFPVVVKASGLAAGKGVIVPETVDAAIAAVDSMFAGRFGAAGAEIVVEERLTGHEISVLAFCDGARVALMPAAQDHKRVFDGDAGPNTGGMGAFAPTPKADPAFLEVAQRIVQAVVDGMAAEGTPLKGVLYTGFMCPPSGPKVLEFNVRFGDPETQVILPLLDADLYAIIQACAQGALDPDTVQWRDGAAATVVAASAGYPGAYAKGMRIEGVAAADALPAVTVYQAGTRRDADLQTAGGRVLAVTGQGSDLGEALDHAYRGIARVQFEGMHHRTDIGAAWRRPTRGMTYADAGVDIDAGAQAVAQMKAAVQATHGPAVLGDIGAFGGLFSTEAFADLADPVLVTSADGVGTKTKIAAALGRFDTIGQDLVNHCINDTLVQGARPLFFLDYVASSALDPDQVAALVRGCAQACEAVGCALLGGETAEMPGVYVEGEFDLVGTLVGVVDRAAIIDGSRIAIDDAVIALPSSGLHTNGYSLARRIVAHAGLDLHAEYPGLNETLGDALLAPHRCYLDAFDALQAADVDIRGLAHITGGGLVENPPRILSDDKAFQLAMGSFDLPPLFALLQKHGNVADFEMRRAFNVGVGLLVVLPQTQISRALAALPDAWHIGRIVPRDGQSVVFA